MNKKILTHFTRVDSVMAGLARKLTLKPRRRPTENRFEYLALTILYQQLSTKAASTIAKRFRELFAGAVFPKPQRILKISDEKLRSVGISRAKINYIKDLAHKVHHREVLLESLHTLTDEDVIQELTKIKGVGRWTADMFLMSALARPDVFSFGDLGLKTAIMKAYGFKTLPSEQVMKRLADRWSPYRSTAAKLLWVSLDTE